MSPLFVASLAMLPLFFSVPLFILRSFSLFPIWQLLSKRNSWSWPVVALLSPSRVRAFYVLFLSFLFLSRSRAYTCFESNGKSTIGSEYEERRRRVLLWKWLLNVSLARLSFASREKVPYSSTFTLRRPPRPIATAGRMFRLSRDSSSREDRNVTRRIFYDWIKTSRPPPRFSRRYAWPKYNSIVDNLLVRCSVSDWKEVAVCKRKSRALSIT